jgi:hypothetical protein
MFRKIILSLCLSLPQVTSAENLALTSKELGCVDTFSLKK